MTKLAHSRYQCPDFQTFLNLSRELRDTIYIFCFTNLPTRLLFTKQNPISTTVLQPHALPNICFTSKQVQREAILIYLQRTHFIFDLPRITHPFDFYYFASRFNRGLESVRRLSFYDITWYSESARPDGLCPEALVSRCTGLRKLTLEMHASRIFGLMQLNPEGELPRARMSTQDEVKRIWGFNRLFKIESLRCLRIVLTLRWEELEMLGRESVEGIEINVVAVLREGFGQGKSRVETVVQAVLEERTE